MKFTLTFEITAHESAEIATLLQTLKKNLKADKIEAEVDHHVEEGIKIAKVTGFFDSDTHVDTVWDTLEGTDWEVS